MYLSWQCARSKNRIVSLMQQLQIQSQTARTLYSSTLKFQENKQVQENPKQDAATGSSERVDFAALNRAYKPNGLEKRILVWTGKYKSIDEIPGMVSRDEMERSRSKARIRISNILMVLSLVGCIIMVRSGKKAAEEGETLMKQNLDWHKKYNEEVNMKEESSLVKK